MLLWRTDTIAAEKKSRVNEEITAPVVRVIAPDGEQLGIMPIEQALEAARERAQDLVEIAPQGEPPVCRIMDYGKYRFDQSKKRQAARRKQKQVQIKEVKFRPGTDEGDYRIKLRNLTRFLNNGDKVKITLRFRGREMAHRELGAEMLKRIEADLSELATVEQYPKMEGRQMVMVMAPRRS